MKPRGRLRYAARKDTSQGEVVSTLTALGCSVFVLPSEADSLPDLLVGMMGQLTYVVEVKNPNAPERGLTPSPFTPQQDAFWELWRGNPKVVLHDREDAYQWVTKLREAMA